MPPIAFLHPDLGIGGAERLVVDAAVGLQDLGNDVTVFTSHCDKSHCFDEVASGKLRVKVHGDFLPTQVLQKFHILFAILRQLFLVATLVVTGEVRKYDYFVVDQLSFAVPFLSVFSKPEAKVLFYCHFPDQLLVRKGGLLKKLYRVPFDRIEEWTTGTSDQIVVNSSFTKSIFHKTFTNLGYVDPKVIYPCIDKTETVDPDAEKELAEFLKGNKFFLSINRFERLKNVPLAIKAYAKLKEQHSGEKLPKLIIAGGFDPRVAENVQHLRELEQLCDSSGLKHNTFRGRLVVMPTSVEVLFMPSVKTSLKNAMLRNTELLLYTPTFEHFGIVPVESMLNRTPVLAINYGGPLESIVNYDGSNLDEATGFNRENDVDAWASVLKEIAFSSDSEKSKVMGENGYKRATSLFSREEMSEAFYQGLLDASKSTADKGTIYNLLALWKIWVGAIIIAVSAVVYKLLV
ncbi:hypothetical protein FT663_01188 [Candidozyma haemuli var. vulneris]|uniref:Alpha-1,3/1,6-mannosyltransferase ALG2 n=1 Tax=Candidozyma haemuli TaxID=45357 RepID=A0A2V1AX96_9ASCO|nr:hypothetical protein CXQ85_005402 [[Candida] haemuloni]KAF3992351.1 hypothetical protein FT662_01223 [[Candida] haemuloni var. vulneris]KAF3994721.1 hypothetical protein FT663_01188 [[Candida] haemuloni var. vulneris]PVH22720.1 hypothetical protein CXQ85_005402 [[Candida] haemuloni]